MKNSKTKSFVLVIGITLILVAVLSRRLFIRSLPYDFGLSFIAAFALIFISFIIFRMILKNRK